MAAFLDVCRYTPTLGGTTDWTFSAAVVGYQSPAAAGVVNGRLYKYRAESADLSQWEVGEGAYNTGTGVLARITVLFNSSGTTSKINFSTVPQVAVVALKEDLIAVEEANAFSATQQAQARSNIYAAPFDALGALGIEINGSMDISQENAATQITGTSGGATRTVDQFNFFYNHVAATAVIKSQQVAPPGSPSFGLAFPNCIQLTSTTALSSPAAGDYCTLETIIEGYRWARLGFGDSNAQSVTISFWIYATIAGSFSVSVRNRASSNRSYLTSMTINNAATWEYKTLTVPGDQSGTWLTTNGQGGIIDIGLDAASNFSGTAGSWTATNNFLLSTNTNFFASNNNVVCVTGFKVLPGSEAPVAARSPFIMRPYDQELLLCQRHFRKSFPQGTACAQNAGVAGAISVKNPIALGDPSEYVPFSPSMRAAPTITTYNPSAANANWRDITAASDVTVSVDPGSTLSDGGVLLATSGTVTTLGDVLAIHYKADARL